jgi:hypothetical protein
MRGHRVKCAVMPFCNTWERDTHFVKHGHKLGAADASEYESMADEFMDGPLGDAHECSRPEHDRVRFGFVTHLEGIARPTPAPECIRTFYPVMATTIARHGGEAGYFTFECNRQHGVDL